MTLRSAAVSRRALAAALAAMLFLSVGTGVAAAQSFEGAADSIIVGPDESYDSVQGFAGTVIVRGTVTGDVSVASGTVHVTETGEVGGDVSAAAGTVRIDGTVGGDVSAAAGTVEISETARIGGNLESGASYISVDGAVEGDVAAGAETVVLGPNAVVGGEFRYDAETFRQDPAASVAGGVVRDDGIGSDAGPDFAEFAVPAWLGALYGLFVNLLLGVVLLAVFPAFSTRVADRVAGSPAKSGGVGLLTLIAVPLVLAVLVVTIVGIPLSLVGAFVFGVTAWVALVYGQYAVGAWALSLAGEDNRWLALLVGLVGFAVLGAIPIFGGLFQLVAFLLGLGALALALRETYRGRGEDTSGGRQTTLDESSGGARAA
ncbi:bactofilin family protein [Haloarcula nitratireducens]|uniref:Polymer-forming cytoskeletal protein n=1 Tax=Haloarcula nitratireducens TaxID=2487749 RepID=A0AAW4P714_9EURY|nr:polymer-forming cytoskeletal protein [Halomicroarcula nitratireducens]MBX0293546.1 polymer-forming cytoskeletal protein [Halomicroarcula nitratireducens]